MPSGAGSPPPGPGIRMDPALIVIFKPSMPSTVRMVSCVVEYCRALFGFKRGSSTGMGRLFSALGTIAIS